MVALGGLAAMRRPGDPGPCRDIRVACCARRPRKRRTVKPASPNTVMPSPRGGCTCIACSTSATVTKRVFPFPPRASTSANAEVRTRWTAVNNMSRACLTASR
eukprot:4238193-Alexandrium_andersonii.AAC.1